MAPRRIWRHFMVLRSSLQAHKRQGLTTTPVEIQQPRSSGVTRCFLLVRKAHAKSTKPLTVSNEWTFASYFINEFLEVSWSLDKFFFAWGKNARWGCFGFQPLDWTIRSFITTGLVVLAIAAGIITLPGQMDFMLPCVLVTTATQSSDHGQKCS